MYIILLLTHNIQCQSGFVCVCVRVYTLCIPFASLMLLSSHLFQLYIGIYTYAPIHTNSEREKERGHACVRAIVAHNLNSIVIVSCSAILTVQNTELHNRDVATVWTIGF